MARFWDTLVNRLRQFWSGSTLAQKILLGGMLATILIVFVLVLVWLNKTEYGVLYANLSSKDASRVVEVLKNEKVGYRLKNGGSSVLVPKDRIYGLRLQLAGQDVLKGQGVGFEIFNQTQVGQTDFVQQVNYQRALQGELSRTISSIPAVKSARVHLVLPDRSLFIEEQNPATASILLNLEPGEKLGDKQVESVVSLAVMAVEGLSPDNVSVVDTDGTLLYQASQEGSFEGLTTSQLEYKQALENKLRQRIERMLTPVLGMGRILARVNAEVDFSRKTIQKEIFDPDSAVVRSEQKTREKSKGSAGASAEEGNPEVGYQGQQTGTGTSQESSRTQSTTNFEINREEQQIVVPQGQIDTLSAAVIVDGTYKAGQNGNQVFVPRADKELEQIRSLVMRAIGYDSARGDAIEVTSMPFSKPESLPEPSFVETALNTAQKFWKPLLNAVVILLFLLLVVRPIVLAILKPSVVEEEVSETAGLPGSEEQSALGEGGDPEALRAREAKQQFDDLKARARDVVEKNREEAMNIVKQWIHEEAKT